MRLLSYEFPQTLDEAYTLIQKRNTFIIGGGMWLRLQKKKTGCAVDLSKLGLSQMEETEDGIRIGASVTLRQLETSELLNRYTHGAVSDAFSPIVGVQFRNLATIGGSLYGRFGFSDVLTLFSALGAEVEFYHAGRMTLDRFAENGVKNDILTDVYLPKQKPDACVYSAVRNTATDFPVLNTALCLRGEKLVCSVGARPLRTETISVQTCDTAAKEAFAASIAKGLIFGSTRRASAEYRKRLCAVLLRRGLEKMEGF